MSEGEVPALLDARTARWRGQADDDRRPSIRSLGCATATRASLRARVATSRSVLGGPDRRRPSARTPPIATEFRPVVARYPRPMARIGAPHAHRLSHSQAKPRHHLVAAQPPALEPAGHPWRKPMRRLARRQPRGHGQRGARRPRPVFPALSSLIPPPKASGSGWNSS